MINTFLTAIVGLLTFAASASEFPHFNYSQNDTLIVVSVGENNSVSIDSTPITTLSLDSVPQSTSGEITQTGKNNKVEIVSNKPSSNQKVTIKQTGKNNSIKINSQ